MVAHLAYVICDLCGAPASQPVDGAEQARRLVPRRWLRVLDTETRKRIDVCPECAA